ncbi:unnamed protein product [Lactuca virosa]|uniref:Uncharacterized protein n=1 Tax=Lactuca virosa TaxID=75947 RepID=A0AAU9NXE7_9ASTR|nr:unnamed protein product [Lactuca virosa]
MPSLSGLGILWLIIARSAEITSWICVSNAKLIRQAPPARSVLLLGVSVTMLFTFTALAAGSRLVKCALLTTVSGSSRNMVIRDLLEWTDATKLVRGQGGKSPQVCTPSQCLVVVVVVMDCGHHHI